MFRRHSWFEAKPGEAIEVTLPFEFPPGAGMSLSCRMERTCKLLRIFQAVSDHQIHYDKFISNCQMPNVGLARTRTNIQPDGVKIFALLAIVPQLRLAS